MGKTIDFLFESNDRRYRMTALVNFETTNEKQEIKDVFEKNLSEKKPSLGTPDTSHAKFYDPDVKLIYIRPKHPVFYQREIIVRDVSFNLIQNINPQTPRRKITPIRVAITGLAILAIIATHKKFGTVNPKSIWKQIFHKHTPQ